jgi:hypothetical protein
MARPSQYPLELRRRAVRMVAEVHTNTRRAFRRRAASTAINVLPDPVAETTCARSFCAGIQPSAGV